MLSVAEEIFCCKSYTLFTRIRKESQFRKYPIFFNPKVSPSNAIYSPSKITFNGNRYSTVFIDQDLSRRKSFLFQAILKGYVSIGLSLKSMFSSFLTKKFTEVNGSCTMDAYGIYNGSTRIYGPTYFYFVDRPEPRMFKFLLDVSTHTLYFYDNERLLNTCVINVPANVSFAVGNTSALSPVNDYVFGGFVEVRSLTHQIWPLIVSDLKCTPNKWQMLQM